MSYTSPPAYKILDDRYSFSTPPPPPPLPPRVTIPSKRAEPMSGPSPAYSLFPESILEQDTRTASTSTPSTSYESPRRRPLPIPPAPMPTATTVAPPPTRPAPLINVRSDITQSTEARPFPTNHERTVSAPPGPIPGFSTDTRVVSQERLAAALPPTPPHNSSPNATRPRRNRESTQSSSPSVNSLGSSNSRGSQLSPLSANSGERPPWVIPYRLEEATQPIAIAQPTGVSPGELDVPPTPLMYDSGYLKKGDGFDIFLPKGSLQAPPAYGRDEPITGSVELRELDKVREIEVELRGELIVNIFAIRGGAETNHITLFKEHRKLYSSTFRHAPGPSHQFQFVFPKTCEASGIPLPPTWKLETQGLMGEVKYTIRAHVRRSGMSRNKDLEAPLEYFPRTAPPMREPGQRPRLRTLLIEDNIPPMGRSGVMNPMVPTRFECRISLEDPTIYPSGTSIPYTVTLCSEAHSSIPASLDIEVELIKVTECYVRKKKEEVKQLLAYGENFDRQVSNVNDPQSTRQRRPNSAGGNGQGTVVIIKGAIVAGGGGEEMSWRVDNTAAVKYFLRCKVVPKKDMLDFATFIQNLPHFEHQEEIVLTTDNSATLMTGVAASLPAVGLGNAHRLGRARANTAATTNTTTSGGSSPTNGEPGFIFGSLNSNRSGLARAGRQETVRPPESTRAPQRIVQRLGAGRLEMD